jgi:hypothetical protein
MRGVIRSFSLTSLACICGIAAIGWRPALRHSVPAYTIAFKSFAPNNTDIFIADSHGLR